LMNETATILISIGGVMLLGMITNTLGQRTLLPRVTLLLIFGILIGPNVFDLIPQSIFSSFDLFANVALLMIGFLVGGHLTRKLMHSIGRELLAVSLGAVIGTVTVVALCLSLLGLPVEIAIMLGCIATATDPAATMDVIEETHSGGRFSELLTSIVALDDALGLIIFSLGVALTGLLNGADGIVTPLLVAAKDILGAVAIGVLIGVPAAYFTGRIQPGRPMLFEALGIVFLCGGLALYFEVSYLLAAIVMGMVVVNLAEHHDYPFHEIENIEQPFLILFFVLAGASLQYQSLLGIGVIGFVYILARIAGKVIGVQLGGRCCQSTAETRNWMGFALLPQAGVAMGMALVAAEQFPDYRQLLLSVVISTTIFFELVGPVFTGFALRKASDGSANVS
ncbi:MAG: cation:proton antiporter, partial [Gammaproteobacteria bacterium]